MTSSNTIFLEPGMSIVIDGVTMTGEQIRDAIIDAAFLKGRLNELLGGE